MRERIKSLFFEGEVLRLMSLTMLIKPIGLLTQILIADYFGAGEAYDAYALAFFLVNFVDLTIGRVFSATIIPYTIQLKETLEGRRLFAFQNATYLMFLVPGLVYMALLLTRNDLLLGVVAHDAPAGMTAQASRFLRLMAVPGLLLLLVALLKSTLNLNRRFRLPAAMPVVHGLVFLAVVVLGHGPLGILCLPLAVAASAAVQVAVLLGYALARRCLAPAAPSLPSGAAGVIWGLSWLIFVSTAFQTVNAVLDKMFAAGLVTGSISSINYAQLILNTGLQLFTLSLVTIMFTRMSELIAGARYDEFLDYIGDNLRRINRLAVPGSLALAMCGREIVYVLYEHGAFTPEDTARTAGVLSMYLLGLPALIFNAVVTRIYHSLRRMRAKMWLALQFLLTNVAGNLLLIGPLKVTGLALASTIAINAHLWLSIVVLGRYDGLRRNGFMSIVARSYGLATITWAIYRFTGFQGRIDGLFADPSKIESVATAAFRVMFILVVYYGLHFGLKALRRGRG